MASNKYLNIDEIKKAISILKPNNELFEIRILRGKMVWSGYFTTAENALDALLKMDSNDLMYSNIYFTPQKLHEGCSARYQFNTFMKESWGSVKINTTSDNDVTHYNWILVDLDPVRPAGISSSDGELAAAENMCPYIIEYMCSVGYEKYILAFSGNGYHILFKYEAVNNDKSQENVKQVLETLKDTFNNDFCKVDTTNCNPGRIFKLYGTLAQKGRDTKSRPHRFANILEVHLD